MPFTQISLLKGKSLDYRRDLMEEVYLAMRESINIPENDRFATITELEDGNFNNSGDYLGINRSDDIVYIQITLNGGRTTDKKKALYAKIAERLQAKLGIRTEDIVISLLEVSPEDWSLGNGEAQYA
jgi:phenylpyruvate tautomerase PptA (4-oxalocrotonate tautomerase family)